MFSSNSWVFGSREVLLVFYTQLYRWGNGLNEDEFWFCCLSLGSCSASLFSLLCPQSWPTLRSVGLPTEACVVFLLSGLDAQGTQGGCRALSGQDSACLLDLCSLPLLPQPPLCHAARPAAKSGTPPSTADFWIPSVCTCLPCWYSQGRIAYIKKIFLV